MGRTKIVNPPSIPSHLNIYGYDVNEVGQLVKQQSNLVGFSGNTNDQVGPGDYDLAHLNALGHTHHGVVAWKKPTQQPASIQNIQEQKKKKPGPGDYNVDAKSNNFTSKEDVRMKGVRGTSSFQSQVQRAATAAADMRLRSNTAKTISRVGRGFIRNGGATMDQRLRGTSTDMHRS